MSYYSTLILGESPPPQAYWRMNTTSGSSVSDATGDGYTGALSSGVTLGQPGAIVGDSDTSIGFTGPAFFAFPQALGIASWTALSIEFWIKQTGLWEHVVVVASTSAITYYLDGAVYVSGSGDPVLVAQDFSFIGSYNAGELDEIAVYNYGLSATQIKKHFLVGQLLLNGGVALGANGPATASFDHLRATSYPDPSVSLQAAGRAANSVTNWNAVVPNSTSLVVTTSLDDGATYQHATLASDICGITTQLYSTLVFQGGGKSNLLRYYRFDESSGTVASDLSPNAKNGTLSGAISLGAAGLLQGPGESTDTAYTFSGGNVSVPTTGLPTGANPWTVCAWIKTTMSSTFQAIFSLGATSAGNAGFDLAVDDSGSAHIVVTDTNGPILTGPSLSVGSAYFVCATYDGTTILLYLNGEQVGSFAYAYNLSYGTALIGTDWYGDTFAGTIDEPAIYSTVLFADEVFALYNAGLAGVGTTQSDSFTSDTSASYTQTFGTGGSAATATWDTTDSRLTLVGGSKAQVLFAGLWAYDTDILADFYQSENGGLIWGRQDASNYYELIIKDSGASSGANTMTLNKVVAGSSTQLATASIAFTAQTHHRFHLTMLSATIIVAIDGVNTLAYTDTSPLPAGLAGLRNDTGTSYCYLLQITPQPVDLSARFLCTKQSLVTSDPTATPQITDHQSMASDKTFGVGTMISSIDNRQTMVSDNISNLVTQSNYWWRINDGSGVEFQPRDASDSPWILQPTDILTGSLPTVEYSADMYRNRQVLTGVFDTAQFTETRPGDGQTRSWSLSNPVVSPPTIWLNNNPVSVGINGTDTGKQYYYQPNNNTITQDNSQPILTETDLLKITYTGSYAIDFAIDNTGQIANTLSQASMAAIDGTTGVTEAVEDVSQQNMDREAATTYANQLLSRYGQIARTITFQTLHTGLKCGQSLPIFLPQYNIFDSVFLIVQVDTSVRTLATGDIQYVYSVTASEAAALSSWVKMFSKVMRGVTGTKVHVKA